MREIFGADVELKASGGGVFEVKVDDRLVHSRKASGEFPDDDRLIAELKG